MATLAIRTGISPRALLDSPDDIVEDMVRQLLEEDQKGAS